MYPGILSNWFKDGKRENFMKQIHAISKKLSKIMLSSFFHTTFSENHAIFMFVHASRHPVISNVFSLISAELAAH